MNQSYYSLSILGWVLGLGFFLLISCQEKKGTDSQKSIETNIDPYAHIADADAVGLLKKTMDAAGGLDTWNALSEISFRKKFKLFAEDQSIEQDRNQVYTQRNNMSLAKLSEKPDPSKDILYQLGPDLIQISGDVNPGMDKTALRNSVLSASFVISIPFKLLDTGAVLSYGGKDKLENGKEVEVLKVVYNPDAHANHSTPDIWWHYFDAQDYRHLAYKVQHADHISYVENTELTEEGGVVFPLSRKSWRVDEEAKPLWLRATYEYSEFKVE